MRETYNYHWIVKVWVISLGAAVLEHADVALIWILQRDTWLLIVWIWNWRKKKLVCRSQSDLRAATEKLHSQTQNQAFQTNTVSGQKISIFNLWFRVLAFDLTKTLREREKKKTKSQCFNGITKRRRWRRRMHVDCRRISASPEKDSIHGIAQKCQHRSQTCKCCASWLHFRIHQKVLERSPILSYMTTRRIWMMLSNWFGIVLRIAHATARCIRLVQTTSTKIFVDDANGIGQRK